LEGLLPIAAKVAVLPVAFELLSVNRHVDSKSVAFVILPGALVEISISENNLALSVHFPFLPVACINVTVGFSFGLRPLLNAEAVLFILLPLSFVDYASVKGVRTLGGFRNLFLNGMFELHI
jgi:hypothetical protein